MYEKRDLRVRKEEKDELEPGKGDKGLTKQNYINLIRQKYSC